MSTNTSRNTVVIRNTTAWLRSIQAVVFFPIIKKEIDTLGLAARLEEWAGDRFLAQRWQFWRETIAGAIRAVFWDEERGLFADVWAHKHFSEHTQCLALLSGALSGEQYTLYRGADPAPQIWRRECFEGSGQQQRLA